MDTNPYESPREKGREGKGGLRLVTIGVFVMLGLLVLTCVALVIAAYWILGLG